MCLWRIKDRIADQRADIPVAPVMKEIVAVVQEVVKWVPPSSPQDRSQDPSAPRALKLLQQACCGAMSERIPTLEPLVAAIAKRLLLILSPMPSTLLNNRDRSL